MTKKTRTAADKLIVALDLTTLEEAVVAMNMLKDTVRWVKIGSQLYTGAGPEVVRLAKETGLKVFLDLKFYDIPATVSLAGVAAAELGVDMFNVHAAAGSRTMKKVAESLREFCVENRIYYPLVVAVTVLTSLGPEDMREIGYEQGPMEMALRLASLAKDAGLDGVVVSPEEIRIIKDALGDDFCVVTPGVRPAWAALDDQKRVRTPAEAVRDGADFIVVGRPIVKADDPPAAARRILEEMDSA